MLSSLATEKSEYFDNLAHGDDVPLVDLQRRIQTPFGARPYPPGSKEIPSLPHLIVVPGTLLSQWVDELHILFNPRAVDIYMYPTSKDERQKFWATDGPFHSSNHQLSNRIILAPHSAFLEDYNSINAKSKKCSNPPRDTPPMLSIKQRADISKTLFGQKYLNMWMYC
ncbi:hypothetical protein BDN70DRAFT_940144 [Pholiota conissans]|uniref:SNF2 N-terminal domain-containing protein n=1 Tax=Pholiota conissans TaxID=109636 RepID=A0A9P6CKJ2_9AGAR|nr:hypothetical protein BDN70DRAFT_940144 [Pholiota conissans]